MSLFCEKHNFLNRKFQRKTNCGRIKYVRRTPNDYSIVAFVVPTYLQAQSTATKTKQKKDKLAIQLVKHNTKRNSTYNQIKLYYI